MEHESVAADEIARLEKIVAGDAGAPAFAALADAHRRAGRPEKAEQIARDGLRRRPDRWAGRVALGLALLDQGRQGEARAELERVLQAVPDHVLARSALEEAGPAPPAEPYTLEAIDDAELEAAFESAEADRETMVDADTVAQQALRQADLDPEEPELGASDSPFATRTVADLLERQGDLERAEAVRQTLARREGRDGGRETNRIKSQRMVDALERWLDKLVRGRSG